MNHVMPVLLKHQPHVSGAASESNLVYTGRFKLPITKTPNLRLSHRAIFPTMTLKKYLLNMTKPIDLNVDSPESKVSFTAAGSPSSDLGTYERGKRYILCLLYKMHQTSQMRKKKSTAPPLISHPLI